MLLLETNLTHFEIETLILPNYYIILICMLVTKLYRFMSQI